MTASIFGSACFHSKQQLLDEIKKLEKEMSDHARNLEFEKAAQVRDRLTKIREMVFGASPHESDV